MTWTAREQGGGGDGGWEVENVGGDKNGTHQVVSGAVM